MGKQKLKKISAFLPADLLREATKLTDRNQTETLIDALNALISRQRRETALRSLRKFHFDFDVETVRQRKGM